MDLRSFALATKTEPGEISKSLEWLMRIQEIDLDILFLTGQKATIPETIAQVKQKIAERQAELKLEENLVVEASKRVRHLESQLKFEEEKIHHSETKLMSVKTNEEYRAALKEIEERKALIDQQQEAIIMGLDEISSLKKKLDGEAESFEEHQRKLNMELAAKEEEFAALEPKIEALQKQKEAISQMVSQEIFKKYQRIQNERGGIGIAEISGTTCMGCQMDVPPQLVNEILRFEKIYTCPNCGRILRVTSRN